MNAKDLIYIALFAALTAGLGTLPPFMLATLGVPITAQSMGPMLAGSILGAKRGTLALILFLLLAAMGLPVFAGARGGLSIFFGPGAGFVFGWPIAAFTIGFLFEYYWQRLNFIKAALCIGLGGVIICYVTGILWLNIMAKIPLMQAVVGSMLFLPGDLIKVILAANISLIIKRTYPLIKV